MGDDRRAAFQAAFERHFEAVYGYVAYRTAPDRQAAADLTQEVFLAALQGWGGRRANGSALGWLRGIARRKVADHFRRRATTAASAGPQAAADPAAAASDDGAQQRAVRVARVMRALPPAHAEVLEAKYLDGLSVREIAGRRSSTEKAVESALSRARAAFRDTYNALIDGEEHDNELAR